MSYPFYTSVILAFLITSHICVSQLFRITQLKYFGDNGAHMYFRLLNCGVGPDSAFESVKWTRNGTTLSVDGELTEAAPSRYQVSFRPSYQSSLILQNTLKQDEAFYTCSGTLNTTEGKRYFNGSIFVSIEYYLPPLDYPKCSIEPGNTVAMGNNVTFNCAPGESDPRVSLELILQRQDGSSIQLDIVNNRVVTMEDNNGTFVCRFLSRTVSRNCSVGPLTVVTSLTPTTLDNTINSTSLTSTTTSPRASPLTTTSPPASALTTTSPPAPAAATTSPTPAPASPSTTISSPTASPVTTTSPSASALTTTPQVSSATESIAITPNECPDPNDGTDSSHGSNINKASIPIIAGISIITVVAIIAVVVLILKFLEQKKIIASLRRNQEDSKNKRVDEEAYMELDRTQIGRQEDTDEDINEYEDVNAGGKPVLLQPKGAIDAYGDVNARGKPVLHPEGAYYVNSYVGRKK